MRNDPPVDVAQDYYLPAEELRISWAVFIHCKWMRILRGFDCRRRTGATQQDCDRGFLYRELWLQERYFEEDRMHCSRAKRHGELRSPALICRVRPRESALADIPTRLSQDPKVPMSISELLR